MIFPNFITHTFTFLCDYCDSDIKNPLNRCIIFYEYLEGVLFNDKSNLIGLFNKFVDISFLIKTFNKLLLIDNGINSFVFVKIIVKFWENYILFKE